jgi:hypothetical protein
MRFQLRRSWIFTRSREDKSQSSDLNQVGKIEVQLRNSGSIDSSNAVLMTMQLKSEAMRKWLEDPLERGRDARRGAQDAERGQP